MEKKYSIKIAETIKQFLKDDDWKYFFDPEKGVFQFGLNIDGKMKNIDYRIIVHETDFTVYAFSPIHADDECMSKMAEFLTRANYGLRNGNFEMDCDDGEVRYKCYVNTESMQLSFAVVKESIYCAANMFERYGDGIFEIIFGDVSAEEAINKCENSLHDSDMMQLLDELGIDISSESVESAAAKVVAHLGIAAPDDANNDTAEDNDP